MERAGGNTPPFDPMRVDLLARDALRKAYPVPPPGATGPWFGEEIWISWLKRGEHPGLRYPRTEDEALALAKRLYREVRGGADLGALARLHSDAPGQRAYGYGPVLKRRPQPDDRDRVLVGTRIGELTPLIAWHQGFWFARRIPLAKGRSLAEVFDRAQRVRGRARAIVTTHKDAWPRRAEAQRITKARAREFSQGLMDQLLRGTPFEHVARNNSHDKPSRARGGLLHRSQPGADPEWLRWGDAGLPRQLLEVVLESGTVGRLHPKILDTAWGFVIVQVLERRE